MARLPKAQQSAAGDKNSLLKAAPYYMIMSQVETSMQVKKKKKRFAVTVCGCQLGERASEGGDRLRA